MKNLPLVLLLLAACSTNSVPVSTELSRAPSNINCNINFEIASIDLNKLAQSNQDRFLIEELNKELEDSYCRFYHLNPDTYFRDANYKIHSAEAFLQTQEAIALITAFRRFNKLPRFNGERLENKDLRRVNTFGRLYAEMKVGKVPVLPSLDAFEFYLVAGWGNEGFRNTYFADLANSLVNDFKVPAAQVHRFFPSSFDVVEINAQNLYREISKNDKGRPVVLIGHSMGGNVILSLLFKNPEFLAKNLARAYLVQSPLKGTATASAAHGIQRMIPFVDEDKSGAYSMLKKNTHRTVKSYFENIADEMRAYYDSKVYYVSTSSFNQNTKLGTYLINEENDGTVPTQGTYFKTYGQRLAYLQDIGHTDLFLQGAKSGLTPQAKQAFARTLLLTFANGQKNPEILP